MRFWIHARLGTALFETTLYGDPLYLRYLSKWKKELFNSTLKILYPSNAKPSRKSGLTKKYMKRWKLKYVKKQILDTLVCVSGSIYIALAEP